MCIRDRAALELNKVFEAAQAAADEYVAAVLAANKNTEAAASALRAQAEAEAQQILAPVSYTHLDVYKRQVLPTMLADLVRAPLSRPISYMVYSSLR